MGQGEDFSRSGLREATLKGLRWLGLARGVAEGIAFAAGVVLAHLVPPAEFGRLAVAIVVTELALSLSAEGLAAPLVQRRTAGRAHFESATLIGLVMGVSLMLATLILAPLVVAPLFGSRTATLFQLFSPAFLLAGVQAVPHAALQRRLAFRRISIIEIAGTLIGAGTSVTLAAAAGLDAEAYVLGRLAGMAVLTMLTWASVRPAVPRWRPRELREVAGFGLPAGLAGLTWVGYRNADFAILGVRLSPAQVGYYYRAFSLGVEQEQRISGIIARVIFPVFSRTQDMAHMSDVRARIIRVNATVIFPLLTLFIALAPVLVPWVFGKQWEPATLPAQILAVAGMCQMINNTTGPTVIAAGRPRLLTVFNLVQFVLYAATIIIASSYGLTAVCLAVAAFQIATLLLTYPLVLGRIAAITLGQLVRDVGPATASSALLLAAALPLTAALSRVGLPALPTTVAVSMVAAVVYLAALRRLFPIAYADVVLLARRLLRPSRQSSEPVAATVADGSSAPADKEG